MKRHLVIVKVKFNKIGFNVTAKSTFSLNILMSFFIFSFCSGHFVTELLKFARQNLNLIVLITFALKKDLIPYNFILLYKYFISGPLLQMKNLTLYLTNKNVTIISVVNTKYCYLFFFSANCLCSRLLLWLWHSHHNLYCYLTYFTNSYF